jgi:hypothetical protein
MTWIKFRFSAKDETSLKGRPLEPNHGVCPTAAEMIFEKPGITHVLIEVDGRNYK